MSINSKISEINDMFMLFDNPMDKYTQIIELGKRNQGIPNKYKNEENRIFGCASMAWVTITKKTDCIEIHTDSDTLIVKGLLNIIKFIVDKESKEDILNLNIEDILNNIGLDNSITSQRTNGLINALNKIKEKIKK
tara:strand:+ start:113 stop:520 length:408 start_codon:yes stop_codon:yes gene_type:complete